MSLGISTISVLLVSVMVMFLRASQVECFAVARLAITTRGPGECNCKAALLGPRLFLGAQLRLLGVATRRNKDVTVGALAKVSPCFLGDLRLRLRGFGDPFARACSPVGVYC